jgi:hypothetical protein
MSPDPFEKSSLRVHLDLTRHGAVKDEVNTVTSSGDGVGDGPIEFVEEALHVGFGHGPSGSAPGRQGGADLNTRIVEYNEGAGYLRRGGPQDPTNVGSGAGLEVGVPRQRRVE